MCACLHACVSERSNTEQETYFQPPVAYSFIVAWGRMALMKLLLESMVTGLMGNLGDSLRVHTSTFFILRGLVKIICL